MKISYETIERIDVKYRKGDAVFEETFFDNCEDTEILCASVEEFTLDAKNHGIDYNMVTGKAELIDYSSSEGMSCEEFMEYCDNYMYDVVPITILQFNIKFKEDR